MWNTTSHIFTHLVLFPHRPGCYQFGLSQAKPGKLLGEHIKPKIFCTKFVAKILKTEMKI